VPQPHSSAEHCPKERQQLAEWLTVHGDSVPDFVREALKHHVAVVDSLHGSRYKLSQTLAALRRALGITPSSERCRSGDPIGTLGGDEGKGPKDKRAWLEHQAGRSDALADWHQQLGRRHRKEAKKTRGKLMQLEDVALPDAEEELLTEEQEQAEIAEESRQYREHVRLGSGPDPSLQSCAETLMAGAEVTTSERAEEVPAILTPEEADKVVSTMVQQRERVDFSVSVSRVRIAVEKKVVAYAPGQRRVISGSTAHLGPPRYQVTWEFLAHMAVMVVQYAMPMHRLARMLSTESKRLTSGYLSRLLHYVAVRFVPIYLVLIDDLADAEVLSGDDTSARVLEVAQFFRQQEDNGDKAEGDDGDKPAAPSPWQAYATAQQAATSAQMTARSDNDYLGVRLATELGFEFSRRRREGNKTELHTTTVSGRSEPSDPHSLTVVYRSHLGGFGNLLEILLEKRNKRLRDVIIQSDLATVNLVADPKLLERFKITYAGCASHARRPFSQNRHEDPELCKPMLHFFGGLFLYERCLDAHGRNRENVLAIRDNECRRLWEDIHEIADTMTMRWSKKTKLGDGAHYVIRNFDKLTAYLNDPRLELSNNFSERMLRMEKLIQSGSMFRKSLEGRFALDIMRSVTHTAIAAGAPMQDYLLDVLRTAPDVVEANPESFTPRAWVARRSAHESAIVTD
jgi:hypothetical protein